ncbi:hypothetical protein SAMN05443252_10319 [Bacillus sp. OV322]|uniref:DUF2188 domain-containing protein n=1 Tax=Bacillus sp. OV322 TaxID=1882764 RepID=UPI0008F2377F|nr:DUF2188 domain-containing protein [Bacillus sp. OV322]SFC35477.1 hypothetical protein SAMN05443252_10319 [Bacillus sp. OV322]
MGKNQHVTPHPGGGWQVKAEGDKRPSGVTDTKKEAVDMAREISKDEKSELFIHGKDGQIQSRDSHGHDPFPPRG